MSAPQLTPDLLAEPAQRAARVLARLRVAAVTEAHARLDAGDPDALHDLRVALRRLRSWLRACRPALDDTVSRRSRRAFGTLARETNAARDAEVSLAWLEALRDLPDDAAAAREHLVATLAEERDRTARGAVEAVERRLPRALRRLTRQLSHYVVDHTLDTPHDETLMGAFTADLVRRHGRQLADALSRVESSAGVVAAHQARIAGKRLRYLLEPLDADPRAAGLVARLKGLQDRLGQFHDARLLGERIQAMAGLTPGMAELARRAHRDGTRAFGAFRRGWNAPRTERELARVEAVAAAIAAAAGAPRSLLAEP